MLDGSFFIGCHVITVTLFLGGGLLLMNSKRQLAVDATIFILATAFSLVCLGHTVMLWSLRRNFFIVLR